MAHASRGQVFQYHIMTIDLVSTESTASKGSRNRAGLLRSGVFK